MIIKKIKLSNFRQFKGENTIEFSTDKEKNVTVILGSNTVGKTTIVGAFIWCLYGINNLKEPKSLLNNELAKNIIGASSQSVSVEVTLEHDKKEYIIRREQKFVRNATGDGIRGNTPELKVSYVDEGGETQPISPIDCQSIIEGILPQALSDYFFFDGERIKSINTKSNVVSAVRGLMGIDVYSAGMDHLNPKSGSSVIGKFRKEIDTGKDLDAEKRKIEIGKLQQSLEGYKKKTPELMKEIEYWNLKKAEYSQLIKDNKDVKASQERKEVLEREENYLKNQIDTSEERLITDFNDNSCKFFALPLVKRAINVLNEAKEDGVGIPDMHSRSIDFILQRGKCICGCDLTKNQGAIENIEHERSLLPPQHIGTVIRVFKENLENAENECKNFTNKIKEDYRTWLDSKREIDYKTRELKEISEKIKGFVDVNKLEEKYQEACRQLIRYEDAKVGNREEIIRLTTRIDENEKEINKLFVTNDKNRKIKKYCDYAEAIYEWFKTYYDSEETNVRKELLESINENFSKMYHGSRVITMDSNYKITPVLSGDKSELAKSEGLETVTNFSFIMGLVELARKRASTRISDNINEPSITEPYPIVMDAPFSNTDIKHIENITARLPEVAEQVIIFIMDKDWNYAKKELEKRLGSKYLIEKVGNADNHSLLRREI